MQNIERIFYGVQSKYRQCLGLIITIPSLTLTILGLTTLVVPDGNTMVTVYFILELCRLMLLCNYLRSEPSNMIHAIELICSVAMGVWGTYLMAFVDTNNTCHIAIKGIVITFWLRIIIFYCPVSCGLIALRIHEYHIRSGKIVLAQADNQVSWDTICRLTERASIILPGAIIESCIICNSAYQADEVVYNLDCGHRMHKICLDRVFLERNSCPTCESLQHVPLEV